MRFAIPWRAPRRPSAAAPGADAYTPEQAIALRGVGTCAHCGGLHAIACPRVKRLRFFNTPGSAVPAIAEVEFWPTWDTSRVVYPEDLPPVPPAG